MMSLQKPKTAAPEYSNRKHRRTSSQPSIKTINFASNYYRGQTPIECCNIQEIGNKALMMTTSPSLLLNLKLNARGKTSSKAKRRPQTDSKQNDDIHWIESANQSQYKLINEEINYGTQSKLRTERLVKSSMSEKRIVDMQVIMNDKDKTIQKLRNKITQLQGNKPIPKAEILELENKINIPYGSEMELVEIKRILLAQVVESSRLNDLLKLRCQKLKQIINLFETRVQYEDKLILKHRNVEQLNFLLNQLSDTVMSTTETELNLGMKARDLEYSQHEFKMLQFHFDNLQK